MSKMKMTVLAVLGFSVMTVFPAAAEEVILPVSVGASSTLISSIGMSYEPENIQDYNATTCWTEGVAGNGIGEYLMLEIPQGTLLTGGVIFNGYQKSEDTFYRNAAPTRLRVSTGGEERYIELQDYADIFYGNWGSGYDFRLDQPLVSDGYVMVEISGVRPGTVYEDTCISELRFSGIRPPEENSQAAAAQISDAASLNLSVEQISTLTGLAHTVYRAFCGADRFDGADVAADKLDAAGQAYVLYWYQYSAPDSRLFRNVDYAGEAGYNAAYDKDLKDILTELFGAKLDPMTYDTFLNKYVIAQEDTLRYMNGTGDFGDAGIYYLDYPEQVMTSVTDGQKTVTIVGRIMEWNANANAYMHVSEYSASFIAGMPQQGSERMTFTFDRLFAGVGG